ncbi:hypothetical protein [Comamonas terrigena]|nr:hypothetical protein [Comamonas terrigena]
MRFIIKVPGHPMPYDGIYPSAKAAQQWAEIQFPDAHPASVRCVRGAA